MSNWGANDPIVSDTGQDRTTSPIDIALEAEGVTGRLADVVRSIYHQESGSGRNTKTSNAGAVGGMQIIPSTFNSVADKGWDIRDPVDNARAGVRYVARMYERAGGDPALTAAGYYGGPGGLDKARRGIAVSDPRNPNAPTTLEYGQQVASRLPKQPQNPVVALVERGVNAIIPSAHAEEPVKAGKVTWGNDDPIVDRAQPTQTAKVTWGNDDPIVSDKPVAGMNTGEPSKSILERVKDGAVGAVKSLVKSAGDAHLGTVSGVADVGNTVLNGIINGASALIPEQRNLTSLVTGQEPRNAVQRWNDERNASLKAFNSEHDSFGFNLGRLTGNIGATGPVGEVVGLGLRGAAALPGLARVAPGLTALGDAAITGGAVPTNFASNAAGAATRLAGGALTGGASAALINPDDAAMGAGMGAVGGPAFAGMGRMISPMVRPAIQKFQAEGITPTLGQLIGPNASKVEEKLTSLPVLGTAIKNARERVFSEVNDAAFNRALNPIGEKLPKDLKGHEAVDYVKGKLSEKYNDLLPQLKFNADNEFSKGLDDARANLKSLAMYPEKALARFDEFVDATITSKLDPNGFMDGHTLQRSKGEIERLIRSYKPSQSGDEQRIAGALDDLDTLIRASLKRTNPKHGIELRQLDTGFANYIRVEAAAYKAADGGVATPAHLDAAVKATDKSLRHTEAARGKALMQDLSSPAKRLLGDKVPDSGTAGRAALGVGGLGALYIDPTSTILGMGGGLLASGLYTDTGRKAVAALMTQRPEIAGLLSQGVRSFAPHTGGLLNADELFQP